MFYVRTSVKRYDKTLTIDESSVQAKFVSIRNKYPKKKSSMLNSDVARRDFLKSIEQNTQIFQRECESCERFRKVFSSSFLPACLERWGSQHCAFWSSSECQDSGNNIFSLPPFQIKFHGNQRCRCFGLHFFTVSKLLRFKLYLKSAHNAEKCAWVKKELAANPFEWKTNGVNVIFSF